MITLNYNDYDGCLEVINQVNKLNIIDKLIIVDNCSTDGSYEKIKKFEGQRITVIRTENNGGYSYGYNFGFKYAIEKNNPKYLILCNSDVIFNEKIIKNCQEYLKKEKKCGAASGIMYSPDYNKLLSGWKYPEYWDDVKYRLWPFRKSAIKKRYSYDFSKDTVVDSIAGCFTVFRTQALKDADFYDEDIFLYNEENVIGCRLRNNGYYLMVLSDCSYIHNHQKPRGRSKKVSWIVKTSKSSLIMHTKYTKISIWKRVLLKLCIYIYSLEVCAKNIIKETSKYKEKQD